MNERMVNDDRTTCSPLCDIMCINRFVSDARTIQHVHKCRVVNFAKCHRTDRLLTSVANIMTNKDILDNIIYYALQITFPIFSSNGLEQNEYLFAQNVLVKY